MIMTFDEFVKIVRDGEAKGEIETPIELSDDDLAVRYAIGIIGERKGYPCEITIEEIDAEIEQFAPELHKEREKL